MPNIDLSFVLANPDFVDNTLIVTSSTQTVGSTGLAGNSTIVNSFSGVVTADRGSKLVRQPDGSRIEDTIEIATTWPLTAGNSGSDADVVTWKQRNYTVVSVKDYTTFGAGFVIAICEAIPLSGV